jgi:hypothetical protein
MAMRETVRSLRAYFILVGVMGVARSVFALTFGVLPVATKIAMGVDLVFALAILASGIALRKLLRDSPGLVKGLIYLTAAEAVAFAALQLAVLRDPWVLVGPAIVLLLSWYLLVNVNRLSVGEKGPEQQA